MYVESGYRCKLRLKTRWDSKQINSNGDDSLFVRVGMGGMLSIDPKNYV